MTESILFKNVQLLCDDDIKQGDLFVKGGKIQEIGPSINRAAELELNEPSLMLMPGCIDPHVHFRDPGAEWKEDLESGSRAAAAGGVTSFFDMPNTSPATTTEELMAEKKEIASKKSLVNYNFYIGATPDNCDDLNNCDNVPGIKIYVGSSTGSLLVDQQENLRRIFKSGRRLIAVHSENEEMVQENARRYASSTDVKDHLNVRTTEAAVTCTKELVALSQEFKRRLHICHLTTQEEAEFLASIRPESPFITTEVSPQHLFLGAPDIYDKLGTFAQINPPIRDKRHGEHLRKALRQGVISCMGTDHAPHTIEEKSQIYGKAPSGMPGVETWLPLMLNWAAQGECSYHDVWRWCSYNVAQIFSIENKGRLEVGCDADLVLIDTKAKYRIENDKQVTKSKWSAFNGRSVQGKIIATYVNGNLVFQEGDFFDDIKGQEVQIRDIP